MTFNDLIPYLSSLNNNIIFNMLPLSCKSCFFFMSSFITIPYALAITCNIMYGSPLSKKRYLTLLHPRKVIIIINNIQVNQII